MILTLEHLPLIKALIEKVHHLTDDEYDMERGLYWIENSYLPQKNNQIMFGSFDNENLISICGLRINFPNDASATVGNVFYDSKSTEYIKKIKVTEEAYSYAFQHGCKKVYSIVKDHQFERQWNLCCKFSKYIRSLKMEKMNSIKANETSSEDWINSMLGRKIHNVDYTIRIVKER